MNDRGMSLPDKRAGGMVSLGTVLATTKLDSLPTLAALIGRTDQGRSLAVQLGRGEEAGLLSLGRHLADADQVLRAAAVSLAITHPQRHLQMVFAGSAQWLRAVEALPHLMTPIIRNPYECTGFFRQLLRNAAKRRDRHAAPSIVVVAQGLDHWGPRCLKLLGLIWMEGPRHGLYVMCSSANRGWRLLPERGTVAVLGLETERATDSAPIASRSAVSLVPGCSHLAVTSRDRVMFQAAWIDEVTIKRIARALRSMPGHELVRAWWAKKVLEHKDWQ